MARGAASVKTLAAEQYMPIKALNQFTSDFVIKARVVKKGTVRTYKNQRGEGQLINFDLVDREGTLIQATVFGQAATRYSDTLVPNKVYTFANGAVKLANKKYTSIPNDYCLVFDEGTVCEAVAEDTTIAADGYTFTSLASIEEIVQSKIIDVIGVILDVAPTTSINLRDGSMRQKRNLTIGDESHVSIGVTLWGDIAELHPFAAGQVIALKACRVSDYNGKTLNASNDPRDVAISPKHKRATELQKWQAGSTASKLKTELRSLGMQQEGAQRSSTPTMLLEELAQHVAADSEVQNGKAFYCKLNVTLMHIFVPENDRLMYYLACPTCKRKVHDDGTGYRCEHCAQSHADAVPTYSFSVRVSDCSGSVILNLLGEPGEDILGMKASEFYSLQLPAVRELAQSR